MTNPGSSHRPLLAPAARWWPWIFGVALLVAVVTAAWHLSEGREFLQIAGRAKPVWLWLALACQAATYAAQGEVWRGVLRAAGVPFSTAAAFELSLAKLFVDQTLPSAGVSSSVLVARALDRRSVPRGLAMAVVAANLASYHAAYVMGLLLAVAIAVDSGQANALVLSLAALFMLFGGALTAAVLALAGRPAPRVFSALERFAPVRNALEFLEAADRRITTSLPLLGRTTLAQAAIIALDATTMFALIQSLGVSASPSGVFVSFMVSSLFRTMGVVPGGLGTFEASAVITLRLAGVSLPVALSATLLFRGMSFWLPMLPGWWSARRVVRGPASPDRVSIPAYWSIPADELAARLASSRAGLSSTEAERRLGESGPADLEHERGMSNLQLLIRQVSSPLLWLLIVAAMISAGTREWSDAGIVLTIVIATVAVGYVREHRAERALALLRARIRTTAIVIRDGAPVSVPRGSVVVGDIVRLSAGSLVPADAVVLEATDCYVSEAALTGESFPVQKRPGEVPAAATPSGRVNCVFLGTNVRSGTAVCLVVATDRATEFARIAARLSQPALETDFDRGIRRFGYGLTSAMFVIVLVVFVAHTLGGRPPIETLLFSIALAVGLNPELLPVILSINLARGAQMMARRGVLVRRLNAIENLGSMNILCTDKTGTLTEGTIHLEGAYDASGTPSDRVLDIAALNAGLQSGLRNPLDEAILRAQGGRATTASKIGEIPFDFARKRLSVVVQETNKARLITKGAFANVVPACTSLEDGTPLDDAGVTRITNIYDAWSREGVRALAIATRDIPAKATYDRTEEAGLRFVGFVTFLDRPKEGVHTALADLDRLGVTVKMITGDNRLVAGHVASLIGMDGTHVLTGTALDELDNPALCRLAPEIAVFAEVDPTQKERIIQALRRAGYVVGFLGDGINDAPAMRAADTSLSVDQAVDVARETADFVLLDRDLDVIRGGIEEGRRTFANTMKYILTTTSANLGNMISMAAASLFLPFLPLLAGQILLNNLLSDVPAVGLAGDRVDPELVSQPPRWDMWFIGRFMGVFGLVSSLFDALTFVVLLRVFDATVEAFRTGWFIESLLTELLVALVVRTRRPFYSSRPGNLLLGSSLVMIALTPIIPFLPLADRVGFVPLPASLLGTVCLIAVLYAAATELTKKGFYRVTGAAAPRLAR